MSQSWRRSVRRRHKVLCYVLCYTRYIIYQGEYISALHILKPILFYLLIILFDGSGDINFSYCFAFTFVFRFSLFFLLVRLLRCFTDALHDGCKHLRSSHCLQRARHFSYNFYFSFVVFPPLQLNQACRICLSVTLPPLASKRLTISS